MTTLIVRRLVQLPIILLVIYTVTFALAWALPGQALIGDETRQPPQAVLDAMNARYNLDSPSAFYVQYLARVTGVRYAGAALAGEDPQGPVFDFGPSFFHEDWTVNDILASSLPVSVTLGLTAVALATIIGVTVGVIGAVKPRSFLDLGALGLALIGVSLPNFVIGTALLVIFPLWIGIGRVGGWGTPADLVLPAVTLSLPFAAYIARLTRIGMGEAMSSDYVRTARAKGCANRSVLLRHALKNAFLPVLSFLGPACAYAMTGSFVVEMVFDIPGVGQHFVDSVRNKDLFVIMGVTLTYSSIMVLANLVVDVLYRFVDPRIE